MAMTCFESWVEVMVAARFVTGCKRGGVVVAVAEGSRRAREDGCGTGQ